MALTWLVRPPGSAAWASSLQPCALLGASSGLAEGAAGLQDSVAILAQANLRVLCFASFAPLLGATCSSGVPRISGVFSSLDPDPAAVLPAGQAFWFSFDGCLLCICR